MDQSWFFHHIHDRNVALVDLSGLPVTYAELRERAVGWTERILKVAEGRRPLVALEFGTSSEAIAAYLGVLKSGLPVLVVEPGQLSPDTRMDVVWRPEMRIAAGPDGAPVLHVRTRDADGITGNRPDAHPDLAVLLSTSGTTGDSKLVRLSKTNIASNAAAIAEYLAITPGDRAITTLPLFYSYGLSVLHSYLAAGAALILNERSVIDPRFWESFRDHGATSMALVPHQFNLLARHGFTGDDLPGLRYITQAGGKLDTDSVRHFHALGKAGGWDLVLMYGQTEAAPRISWLPPSALPGAADTIGRAIPGGRIRVLDENGAEITEPGRPGELIYDGPNVMMGYAESRPDLARGVEVTELRTGDIAERTAGDFFRIVGRMKRFVKIAGLRLSLDQIEAMLHGKGLAAQAVAVDDRLVLLHTEDGMGERAQEAVADAYGLPLSEVRVSHLPEIPLLASGKPDHKALSRIAADVLTQEAARPKARNHSIAEALKSATRSRKVGPEDSFTSLGGDSLSYIQMQIALEERMGEAPAGWETMPLARLEALASAASARPTRSPVSIDVLLRVVAISFVVIQHATDYALFGGVWVLMVLMGVSASRFQMQLIAEGKALRLGFRMLYPILPMYFLLLLAYGTLRDHVPLTSVLLVGEYEIIEGSLLSGYWFVSFYAKVVLILMLIAAVPPARRLVTNAPWATPAVATAALLLALAALLMQGGYVIDQVSVWPAVHYTTHGFIECLPFFLVGWMIQQMQGVRQVVVTIVLAAAMVAVFTQFQIRTSAVYFLAICLCLIAIKPKIMLPVSVARLLQTLASITLFVYLFHQIVITPVYGVDLPDWSKAVYAILASFSAAWVAKNLFDRFDSGLSALVARSGRSGMLGRVRTAFEGFGRRESR